VGHDHVHVLLGSDIPANQADAEQEEGSVAPAEYWEPWLNTDINGSQAMTYRETNPNIPVNIFGTSQLQVRLRQMCEKHERAFRRELVQEPARVAPMKFNVETKIWHDKKNKMPPRLQTRLKNEEIRRQVDAMRSIGIIRDSQASYWSQVLLTPKPNGKWRFCIDYRNLNEATESFGWPIPNIPVMLQRFGAYQAKFFAIFDFTQGYFQCPMSDDSRPYTAFRTQFGLYEWNRVSMGLKSAGSYFQHVMSSSVLGGMIYTMLELYIDDCIIFASSEDELVDRVDKFLTRVIEHNITVNPDKTRMGLERNALHPR
jgi:hypothetical protein